MKNKNHKEKDGKTPLIKGDFGNITFRELIAKGEKELVDKAQNGHMKG